MKTLNSANTPSKPSAAGKGKRNAVQCRCLMLGNGNKEVRKGRFRAEKGRMGVDQDKERWVGLEEQTSAISHPTFWTRTPHRDHSSGRYLFGADLTSRSGLGCYSGQKEISPCGDFQPAAKQRWIQLRPRSSIFPALIRIGLPILE